MELRVGNHKLEKYNEVSVTLRYDSIADKFDFKAFFDPDNAAHKSIFRPGGYQACSITHNGQTLITGVVLSPSFSDSATESLPWLSGYSKTGVLDDVSPDPGLQCDNLSLKEIAERLVQPYGLKVVVDDNVAADCSVRFSTVKIQRQQSIAQNLNTLCVQKRVVLSHTAQGDLLLTRAKADKITTNTQAPQQVNPTAVSQDVAGAPETVVYDNRSSSTSRKAVYNFTDSSQWLNMSLKVDGQKMHSQIDVAGPQQLDTDNAPISTIANPYVPSGVVRKRTTEQTAYDDNSTQLTARMVLGEELKNIVLTIEIEGWTLGSSLALPNQIITVTNKNLFLYKKTRWFVQEVAYRGDQLSDTALLTCVLPEAYNDEQPINIFI